MAEVISDTPLWYFYTSGTTGPPKAAMLTHGQMAFVVTNHLADLIPGTDENDCSIAVAPLSHGAASTRCSTSRAARRPYCCRRTSSSREVFWQLVEKHRVTNLFTVPTIVKMLVEDPAVDQFDHSSLRYVIYAGAPMYRADQKRALQKLGKVLVQYFGLGEVTGCITVLTPAMHAADDDGPERQHRLVRAAAHRNGGRDSRREPAAGSGRHCRRDLLPRAGRIRGLLQQPRGDAKAFRGGWFHTGDLGRMDARGLLYITGRESDMYISGGSNVYPREVEEVLLTHPAVAEVAVLGVPDEKWGEIGVAVVVASQPGLSAEMLLAHLDGRCAKYRWPRQFYFWDSLPKSGYGKVTKKDIRARLIERGDLKPVAS